MEKLEKCKEESILFRNRVENATQDRITGSRHTAILVPREIQ